MSIADHDNSEELGAEVFKSTTGKDPDQLYAVKNTVLELKKKMTKTRLGHQSHSFDDMNLNPARQL